MATRSKSKHADGLVLVSACLAGIDCRYDGCNCADEAIVRLWRRGQAYPVCPERLGGMPTPRPASEIAHGSGEDVILGQSSVINSAGEDVTKFFVFGAWQTLEIVRKLNIRQAILKGRSPSCGFGKIYRKNRLVKGNGVCVSLLVQEGVSITCK